MSACWDIGGTLGKIANEVVTLEHTEIVEIAEPFSEGKVGSSTIPHSQPVHVRRSVGEPALRTTCP